MHEVLIDDTTWKNLGNIMPRHRKPCFMTYTNNACTLEINIDNHKEIRNCGGLRDLLRVNVNWLVMGTQFLWKMLQLF